MTTSTCRHCGATLREVEGSGRYRYQRADTPDTAIFGSGSECPANERGHEPELVEETLSAVPGHIRTANPPGNFCTREGLMTPGGHCPDGCDHADHYSNDGHPECEVLPTEPLRKRRP